MDLGKSSGWTGRGAPLEDPLQIRLVMQELLDQEVEFPIKVAGAHTLPYSARVQALNPEKGLLHLKLIRPLPHELLAGAAFEMLFTAGDQRFEAPCTFHGRQDYLLYRFAVPSRMQPCDRRRHKRYPFRPREKAYVVGQDAGVPGYGVSGPLVNLSMGGLAFRVDRVLQLDEHLRVTPGLGFFERGKSLPMLKIRDLPNLPLFEARGIIANAWERDGEIIVNVQFGQLREAELEDLEEVLTIRERKQRGAQTLSTDATREAGARAPAEAAKGLAARVDPAGRQTPDALLRLGRRSARVVLAMAPGSERDLVRTAFGGAGYLRVIPLDTLQEALAHLQDDRNTVFPVLVLETQPGAPEPLRDLQALQRALGPTRDLSVALITREGEAPEPSDPLWRPLPWPQATDLTWLPVLDELAGLAEAP